MRLILINCICLFLCITSCETKSSSETTVESQEDVQARIISQKDIENLRYTEFELSSTSEEAVADWQKFQELRNQTNFLKKADLNFFSGERLLLTTFFQELTVEMPQQLQTNEIMARMVVLDTKAQKLNGLLRLDNISKEDQVQAIKEYLIAISNLKLQINKKFEYDKNSALVKDF